MGTLWGFLDGKKTALGALVLLADLVFRAIRGEPIDPTQLGGAIIAAIGIIDKLRKALLKE